MFPGSNLGVITGIPSGAFVLDLDGAASAERGPDLAAEEIARAVTRDRDRDGDRRRLVRFEAVAVRELRRTECDLDQGGVDERCHVETQEPAEVFALSTAA